MDLSRYLSLFVADSREHLSQVEQDLVRFEDTPEAADRMELLHAVFRHLHSIKGSAATMGFEPIAQLSHRAEELIGEARRTARALTTPEVDLLLQAADALRELVDAASEGRSLVAPADLLDRLSPAQTTPPDSPATRSEAWGPVEGPATTVHVTVSAKSRTPAARALIILRKLGTLGEIVRSDPALADVRAGLLPGNVLRVQLRGEHEDEALRAALDRIPDVETIQTVAPTAPPPTPASAPPTSGSLPAAEQTVRVHAELLDQLLELAGELVLASARLRESIRSRGDPSSPLVEEADQLRRLVKDLNNRVLATRQTPILRLAERLPRVVRDLSRHLGKALTLRMEGVDVTLDRGLLEALGEPVLHALRNAADHAIEPPEVRVQQGKPAAGQITFAARRERDRVIVELRDDGRGFDVAALRQRAVRARALTAADAAALDEAAALRLAFLPGVSTRDASSDVSGRGVGMDAVLRAIEQLGGGVALETKPGVGSCVRFILPATVSVMNLLLVDLSGEVFGVPMNRVLLAAEASLPAGEAAGSRTLSFGGESVPAYPLGRLVGLPEKAAGVRPFILVEGEGTRTAVGVDRILGQEEVVLRPLSPPLERIRGLAGTAILGSGRPIFVLDVPRLVA